MSLFNAVAPRNPPTQKDDVTIVEETNTLNFEGNVLVTNEGNGKATVTILGADAAPKLMQVACLSLPCGTINYAVCKLWEADQVNHLVHSLIEGTC